MEIDPQADPLTLILGRLSENLDTERAWSELFVYLWPFVRAINFRLTHGDATRAEDATQDVFIKLAKYAHVADFTSANQFRAYVRIVCKNVVRTQHQTSATRALHEVEQDSVQSEWTQRSSVPMPDELIEASELEEVLLEQLQDERDRLLFRLLIDGYSLPDIAERVGLSYANAGVRLHRLRGKLRKHLDRLRTSGT